MIDLRKISTEAPAIADKKEAKEQLLKIAEEIGELGWQMFAERKHSLLIVLQGLDGTGKDSTTKNVFGYCSPTYCKSVSFKKPTEEEFAHDFLWRIHRHAPQKGELQIFIRSHYEDILIQRVHQWITPERVQMRMRAINAWETLLQEDNNTTVLKFYLHISKEEQEKQLLERKQDPSKFWKHNPGDWEERKHWDAYMDAYNDAIDQSVIPWNIIPVDQRWYGQLLIAQKVLDTLRSFKMEWPPLKTEV